MGKSGKNLLEHSFEEWWYNEGSAAPLPTDDLEEHTHRIAKMAWKASRIADKAETDQMRMEKCRDDAAAESRFTSEEEIAEQEKYL